MIVNLNISAETAKRLGNKAAQEGQSLEGFLENLAEHEAGASNNGKSTEPDTQDDEERPWRGVFVLDYPRQEIFAAQHDVNVNALPPLPVDVRIDARRMADESE
jgi:hypothetical protein